MSIRPSPRCDEGASAITTVFGVVIFLGFLMLATQVLMHLYASSTVSSAAFDAARRASAEGGVGCGDAEARASQLLGDYGERAAVACSASDEYTSVTITAPTPARLIDAFGVTLGTDTIQHTARVRTEQFQPAGGP